MILRWAIGVIWALAAAGFVGYFAVQRYYIGNILLPRSQVTALALTVVFVCTLGLLWLGFVLWILSRRRSRSIFDHRPVRVALVGFLLLFVLLVPYGLYLEPRWVVVRSVPLGGKPPAGHRAVRIALISDLHVDGDHEPWRGLSAKVNGSKPDVILFAGDTLNRVAGRRTLKRVLKQMRAPHGKYAVRGNWDVWYWKNLSLLRGTGFRWLDGKRVSLRIKGQRVQVVGFPYRDRERATARRAERLLRAPRQGWRIFLYHTPDLAEGVPSADLYLAGHTHGGQVSVPGFGALVTLSRHGKRFERGLVPLDGRRFLYTNSGIGVEPMIPLRVGVRPEITLLLLGRPGRRGNPFA